MTSNKDALDALGRIEKVVNSIAYLAYINDITKLYDIYCERDFATIRQALEQKQDNRIPIKIAPKDGIETIATDEEVVFSSAWLDEHDESDAGFCFATYDSGRTL